MAAIKPTRSDRIFQIINTVFLGLLLLVIAYPLYFVVIASFSDPTEVYTGKVLLWVKGFQTTGYKQVLMDHDVLIGYKNTLIYTIVGTLVNLAFTMTAGYALTTNFIGKKPISFLITFTMFFGGGMIPTYFLMRNLRILNALWVMVLPGAVSVYNLMITRTFIAGNISDALYEAAEIDGCSRLRFFFAIVVPLSGVLIAILTLFYGVGHWNSYMNAILYLNQRKRFPLQMVLRELLIENQVSANDVQNNDPELLAYMQQLADTMKYSLIIIASVPVLILYPFLQRYFVKGVMIGSVKG